MKETALSGYTNYKKIQPIGIAMDGHVIYGPYDSNGELWDCDDHDICNGHFFLETYQSLPSEFNSIYGYVSTASHPYTVGCYGPAAQ